MKPGEIFGLLRETYSEWSDDNASRLAAALSYFTMFSLGPLLLVVIALAGFVFGEQATRGELAAQIEGTVGREAAQAVQTMIQAADKPAEGTVATIIAVATLLLGATGFFGSLQDALNTIWEVKPRPGLGILAMVKKRFLSFTMVLGVAFLMLVSLVVSAIVSAVVSYFASFLPQFLSGPLLRLVDFVLSFAVITLLFAMIYRILPDAEIRWRDVWLGAAFTSLLFVLGKIGLGIYFAQAAPGSAYGAAGSLVALMVWIFYSSQILFFGAEFTQVHARKYGPGIVPSKDAVRVTPREQVEQGVAGGADAAKMVGAAKRKKAEGLERVQQPGGAQPEQPALAPPRPLVAVGAIAVAAALALVNALRGDRHSPA